MIKWILAPVLLGLLVLATYLYFYLGAHQPVTVQIQPYPDLHLLYKTHIGPYHQINSTLVSIESEAKEHQLSCGKTFGEFLDNPQFVDADRLRSHVGCVLEARLAKAPPDGLLYKVIPSQRYIYATFKGSPAIGPFQVYPKIDDFIAKNRLAMASDVKIELYTVRQNGSVFTEYLIPLTGE